MRTERGSAAVELVLMTPLLIVLLLFVVAGGRLVTARSDLDAAVRTGARAASVERTPAQAETTAHSAITSAMAQQHRSCSKLGVHVDTSQFHSGGFVVTDVDCSVDLGDLSLLDVPVSRTLHAQFSEPIDVYRGAS